MNNQQITGPATSMSDGRSSGGVVWSAEAASSALFAQEMAALRAWLASVRRSIFMPNSLPASTSSCTSVCQLP